MSHRFFPTVVRSRNDYPTSDGRPMAESDFHRKLMTLVIDTLIGWAAGRPDVYVTGNLLLFYEKGNKRRHVAPDCFVAFGVPNYNRLNYLMWDEGRPPNVVLEITSKTTKTEDTKKKFRLYRDTIRVPEYFLFDPTGSYLTPRLQGYRLDGPEYVPIPETDGRLPSQELGLHLERDEQLLRFWNPATGAWVPTPPEWLALERSLWLNAERSLSAVEAEVERLRRENEELRRRLGE